VEKKVSPLGCNRGTKGYTRKNKVLGEIKVWEVGEGKTGRRKAIAHQSNTIKGSSTQKKKKKTKEKKKKKKKRGEP